MDKQLKKFDFNRNFIRYDSNYVWGIYKNKYYELFNYQNTLKILSKSPINKDSYLSYGNYFTNVSVDFFDDIIYEQLYAKYKGKIFAVSMVASQFQQVRLSSAGLSQEDIKEYGFVYDRDYGQYYLDVTLKDAELFSMNSSIYEQLKASNSRLNMR